MQPEKLKIVVNMTTLNVRVVEDFTDLNGVNQQVRYESQHLKMPGYILAAVTILSGSAEINLFHPDTNTENSAADVSVHYIFEKSKFCLRKPKVTFHQDDKYLTDFTPSMEGNFLQNQLWPTGGRSLITTVLAIERYLGERNRFPKTLAETLPLVLIGEPLMQLSA